MPVALSKTEKMKWGLVILITAIVLVIPENAIFTHSFKLFLAITSFFILLVAFELMELLPVAILMPTMYFASGLAPLDVVLSPWTSTMPLTVVGGYMIANTLDRVGFLKRLAYLSILKVGGSYYGMLFGIFIAGTVVNIITGGNAWIIMAAFTFGLCKALNLGKSIDSAIIMLVGGMSAGTTCAFIYSPYFMEVLLAGIRTIDPDFAVTWLQFFIQQLPVLAMSLLLIWITPKVLKPTHPMPEKSFFVEEYEKLGKMSHDEKIGMIASIVLIIFMLTGNIHGIALDWGFIVIPWLLFFPGINIAKREDAQGIDFGMVFFIASCISIGVVSNYLGAGVAIANAVMPLLAPLSENIVLGAIYVLVVILNFLLTPLAILAGFSEPITQIALGLDINPLAAVYAAYIGCDGILLPYEYMTYLVFYAFGLIKMTDFMKISALRIAFSFILVLAIMPFWWRMVGIL